jgi:hypothetical protein
VFEHAEKTPSGGGKITFLVAVVQHLGRFSTLLENHFFGSIFEGKTLR